MMSLTTVISEEPTQLDIFPGLSLGEFVTECVRVFLGASVESDGKRTSVGDQQAKRRERWRRNKRAQRSRGTPPAPALLSQDFEASVWAERDRRRETYPHWLWINPRWTGGRGTYAFQTDVWAVRTLLEKQHHSRKITAGMIARRMAEINLTYDFKPSSLRTMVYRAYKAIAILEGNVGRSPTWPTWSNFGDDD